MLRAWAKTQYWSVVNQSALLRLDGHKPDSTASILLSGIDVGRLPSEEVTKPRQAPALWRQRSWTSAFPGRSPGGRARRAGSMQAGAPRGEGRPPRCSGRMVAKGTGGPGRTCNPSPVVNERRTAVVQRVLAFTAARWTHAVSLAAVIQVARRSHLRRSVSRRCRHSPSPSPLSGLHRLGVQGESSGSYQISRNGTQGPVRALTRCRVIVRNAAMNGLTIHGAYVHCLGKLRFCCHWTTPRRVRIRPSVQAFTRSRSGKVRGLPGRRVQSTQPHHSE